MYHIITVTDNYVVVSARKGALLSRTFVTLLSILHLLFFSGSFSIEGMFSELLTFTFTSFTYKPHRSSLFVAASSPGPFHSQICSLRCCSPSPKRQRKPRGYWNHLVNIKTELENFEPVTCQGVRTVLPSARHLRESGRRDLDNAILKMGGYHKVAELLGWSTSSQKRPPGFWHDFENLNKELLSFVKERSDAGDIAKDEMPTLQQLRDFKRFDIVEAISHHGGTSATAEKLCLTQRSSRKPKHYWKNWEVVEANIRDFVKEKAMVQEIQPNATPTTNPRKIVRKLMPSQKELRTAGRADLAEAITDFHGGFREVAKKLGFVSKKKDDFFYDKFYNLAREVYKFVAEVGREGVMPTSTVLKVNGRTDLAAAIMKFGGMSKVSRRLGLQYHIRTKDAFKDWALFRRSLMAFMKMHGKPGELPTSRTLHNYGRTDLYQAILHHGGSKQVADNMDLKRNLWNDFYDVGSNVLDFISTHGTEGVMPTESEFLEVGQVSLNVAVSKFSEAQVARNLGLTEANQSTNFAFAAIRDKNFHHLDNFDKE